MDRDVQAAVAPHGHRRLGAADRVDAGAVVEVFLAVPFPGRNPPGLAVLGQVELGQLGADADGLQPVLLGEFVAEAQAVVIEAADHVEATAKTGLLDEGHSPFVVMVAHIAALAPGLLPGLVDRDGGARRQGHVALQHGRVGQQEAQPGRVHNLPAQTADRIGRAPVVVGGHLDRQHPARRRGAHGVRGRLGHGGGAEGQGRDGPEGEEGAAFQHNHVL
ncbi:hypothetical protein D3C81_1564500 [compost metagenome]